MKGPWTLPNFITLLRLAALPFFLLSIADGRFGIALGLFVAAGISDGVDGYLARRFDMKSALGAYLDPIADKLLLMFVVPLPRDPVLSRARQGAGLARRHGALAGLPAAARRAAADPGLGQASGFRRRWAGKVTTVTQIVTVLIVLCANVWDWPQAIADDRVRRAPRPMTFSPASTTCTASRAIRRMPATDRVVIRLRLLVPPGLSPLRGRCAPTWTALLGGTPHEWEIVDVDSDDEIARRWSDSIPVLFVNGRLFAKLAHARSSRRALRLLRRPRRRPRRGRRRLDRSRRLSSPRSSRSRPVRRRRTRRASCSRS